MAVVARASNTTPVIVLRFEADTKEALARIQGEFRAALQPLKPDAPLPF
jgi:phosphomannomutase/phosphoglucomutase